MDIRGGIRLIKKAFPRVLLKLLTVESDTPLFGGPPKTADVISTKSELL